jgi:hypothetical protein
MAKGTLKLTVIPADEAGWSCDVCSRPLSPGEAVLCGRLGTGDDFIPDAVLCRPCVEIMASLFRGAP